MTLPDGKPARTTAQYLKAWRQLARPIEKAAALRLHGFDPDLLFLGKNGESVTLPVWFVERINAALKARKA